MARKSVSKVARPRVKCRYNTRRTYPLHRVPFAWKGKPLDTDGPRNLYWNMPEIEGYLNGCDFGKAAASAWLKACLETSSDGANYSAGIGTIVHSLLASYGIHDCEKTAAGQGRRGLVVGFFYEIEKLVKFALTHSTEGKRLRATTEAEIVKMMEYYANRDEAAYIAAMQVVAEERDAATGGKA